MSNAEELKAMRRGAGVIARREDLHAVTLRVNDLNGAINAVDGALVASVIYSVLLQSPWVLIPLALLGLARWRLTRRYKEQLLIVQNAIAEDEEVCQ